MEEILFVDSNFVKGMWYCPWNPKSNIVSDIHKNNHNIRYQYIRNIWHEAGYSINGYLLEYGTLFVFGIPNGYFDGDGI